jgi:hypothetical protein
MKNIEMELEKFYVIQENLHSSEILVFLENLYAEEKGISNYFLNAWKKKEIQINFKHYYGVIYSLQGKIIGKKKTLILSCWKNFYHHYFSSLCFNKLHQGNNFILCHQFSLISFPLLTSQCLKKEKFLKKLFWFFALKKAIFHRLFHFKLMNFKTYPCLVPVMYFNFSYQNELFEGYINLHNRASILEFPYSQRKVKKIDGLLKFKQWIFYGMMIFYLGEMIGFSQMIQDKKLIINKMVFSITLMFVYLLIYQRISKFNQKNYRYLIKQFIYFIVINLIFLVLIVLFFQMNIKLISS